jgi:hypothetical protein
MSCESCPQYGGATAIAPNETSQTERTGTLETQNRYRSALKPGQMARERHESGSLKEYRMAQRPPEGKVRSGPACGALAGTCCPVAISRKCQPFQAVFSINVLNAPRSCAICR